MLLVGAAIGGGAYVVARIQRHAALEEHAAQLASHAQALVGALTATDHALSPENLDKLRKILDDGRRAYAIFATDGLLTARSTDAPDVAILIDRPECRRAVLAGWGSSVDSAHVAAAVRIDGGEHPRILWQQLHYPPDAAPILQAFVLGTLAAIGVAIAVRVTARRIRRSLLSRVVDTARSLSSGDLDTSFESGGEEDLTTLVSSLNIVRRRMRSQISTIDDQRRELESLVDQLQEGVILTRADGRVALMNPVARRWLALGDQKGATSPIGRPIETCIASHDLLRIFAPPPSAIALDDVPVLVGDESDEQRTAVEIDTPQGKKYLLAAASNLASNGGERDHHGGRLVVLSDITELQKTIQLRTDFVANASHELRTPLSTIRAAVETLLDMDLADEAVAAKRCVDTINRHSNRLERLVADLLDLSRIENPGARFEPETIYVHRMLDELRVRFAEELERKKLEWATEVTPTSFSAFRANPQLIRLVLDNLVSNSIRFTDLGGRIKVTARGGESATELEVEDTGCGIPYDEQERVFERFYQVERGRSGPDRGTGLGLSIVRHAIIAMSGQVRLKSTPGRGTTVTVQIPHTPNEPSAPLARETLAQR